MTLMFPLRPAPALRMCQPEIRAPDPSTEQGNCIFSHSTIQDRLFPCLAHWKQALDFPTNCKEADGLK